MREGTFHHPAIPPSAAPGDMFAGRYELRRTLKSGNGVKTFLARDLETDWDVVLKSIDAGLVHAAARLRFEHETQVLRELNGAGLSGLYDGGVAGDRLFLVQPLVAGATLEQELQRGPLSLVDSLRIARDLAAALDIAHGAGICHRDVKPANVMIQGTDPVRAVTLIDFGFARSPWLDESIRDDLVGTVRYLAPESAGLLDTPADQRSDLYALGVLLFECLAGRPPFLGPTVSELLRQHLSMPVPVLREINVLVPRAVDAVIQRLLRKEPAERYQSASALEADLADLLAAIQGGDPDPRLVIGRLDQRISLTDPAFVGRESELEILGGLLAGLTSGEGGLIRLEADSGVGKSRLLFEATRQVHPSGITVLNGQAVAHAAQRPFMLLDGVAKDLVALLASDEPARRALVKQLADVSTAVARALPSLSDILEVDVDQDAGPEQFGELRSLAALRRLFIALATPSRPVLLVLDDCQWADTLTIRLLGALFPGTSSPPHMGVIVAFRSDEVGPDHPLRKIVGGQAVQLGPLPPPAMSLLAESMAGPLPRQALRTVARLAQGSPFMGAAVLRGLVESGALTRTSDHWQVDEEALEHVQTARRSAAFLVSRMELLSPEALELLSAGAVLGKEFDLDIAVALVSGPDAAPLIIEEARHRRLLWVDERTGRCSFFHDKIREALLDRLDGDSRAALHGRAADYLVSTRHDIDGGSVFAVAYHLDAAGRHTEALPYALAGAQLARTQHALDVAVTNYRMAERAETSDLATRIQIAEGLGDSLTLLGTYDEAEKQLMTARELVEDVVAAASLDGKLGELAFKQGDVPTAKRHLEGSLARLGRPIPRSRAILLAQLVWEVTVQVAHCVVPSLTVGRRRAEGCEADFLAMRLYSRLAYVYWFHSGKVPCAWCHLRGMNLAERYPPSRELGQAYSEHAPASTMIPMFGRGLRFAQRSLQIRRDLGDVWGQGQSRSFTAVVLYATSRYEESVTEFRQAIRLLEQTGDQWEVNAAGWNLALALYRAGDTTLAAEVARDVFHAAQAINDQTSAGTALSVWTRARLGQIDGALIEAQLTKVGEDASTQCELQLASGIHHLANQDLLGAVAQLETARRTASRHGLRQEYVAPINPWLATAHRRLAESTSRHNGPLLAARLRRAAAASRRARWGAWSYRNNQPHALRECGLVASLRGRRRRGARLLNYSLQIAEQQGARYEAALSRLALAELDRFEEEGSHGYEEALAQVQAFRTVPATEPEREPVASTVSLFDRFTNLLEVGRTITAAASPPILEAAIRDAALALLRGERCHLVRVACLDDAQLTTLSGDSVDEVSRSLLKRAVTEGGPVVARTPAANESLLLAGVRSVLAAPILVRGEPVSCFYVTHGQIDRLFGDQEIQLAAFIATLAGAALEQLGSETRFRSLAQNSSDVITLVDSEGIVSYQSSAVSRVFALQPSALAGQPVTSWVHPADLNRFTEALAKAARGEETRVECRFQHADGSYRVAETAVTNLLDEPTVSALVLNTRDVTERHALETELRERALHDALTGLPNRALFLDLARQALARGHRKPAPLVVAFMDLDDFKAVNDTFGHRIGDELLGAIAARLVECLRPGDTIARLGGDEFAMLLEDTELPAAAAIVERMLDVVAVPVALADTEIVVRTSIGLAYADDPDSDPDQLLAHADAAMYSAKGRGKHCFDIFEPAMQAAAESRSRLRTEIDRALSRGEFRLLYQPILDLRTASPVGVEALIRWAHPERGLLRPWEFINSAEESGQIVEIGAWALNQACRDATRLDPGMQMSVNVSARQLQHPGIIRDIADALAYSGLSENRLVLEITESATMSDRHTDSHSDGLSPIVKLHELKGMGLQVALDDFGTGYSSLSHMRRFPADYVKIDRSFVKEITHTPEDEAIVRGVIDLAHALGLRVIAEGVEDPAQLAVLLALGCDLAQGFLWMKPTELDDVVAWCRTLPAHFPVDGRRGLLAGLALPGEG
ncbi:MAG: EAL domain-containing protein [Actinomycetota bacterium]|nr:EAL domain-containing protein [Actinomycetota bacterium]